MTDVPATAAESNGTGAVAQAIDTPQREDVDAALRAPTYTAGPDEHAVQAASEVAERLADEFGDRIVGRSAFRGEVTVRVAPGDLLDVARFLRDSCGFALLSDISPCDWLQQKDKRFSVSYHCTRMAPGAPRIRLQVWVDEGEPVPSLIEVWPTADWHEREAYDFFGIWFEGREGLRRLIMPDDWEGHPLRKDYPMGGEPVKFTNSLRETS